jgi:hypothetical protein
MGDWPFEAPRNTAALTTSDVLEANPSEARVVGLGWMCGRDPSLLELADLPEGWWAWRKHAGAEWQRGQA